MCDRPPPSCTPQLWRKLGKIVCFWFIIFKIWRDLESSKERMTRLSVSHVSPSEGGGEMNRCRKVLKADYAAWSSHVCHYQSTTHSNDRFRSSSQTSSQTSTLYTPAQHSEWDEEMRFSALRNATTGIGNKFTQNSHSIDSNRLCHWFDPPPPEIEELKKL